MPRLNLIQAWTAILQYREDSPTESLNIISQGILGQSGSDNACYSGEIALIRGLFAEVRDRDIQVMRKQALLAWENLPERDKMLRSVAAWMLGSSYYYEGDNRNAIKYLQEAISLCRESGNNWVKVMSIADLSNALREEGRLREAHNLLIQTRQELVSSGQRHPMLGLLYMNSGITLMQWNQAEQAEQQILHGLELFSQEVAGEIYFRGIALLVNAKLNQGKRDEAVQLALECLERLRTYPLPYVRLIIQASLVRIWIRLNDRERVEDWLSSCGISVEDTILYRHKGVYYSLAKALVWQGKSEEALKVLSKLYDLLSSLGQEGKLLLLLALKALAYQQMKETDLALDALKSSLKLAETEGFIRAFLDEGQPMEELLLLGMARGIWRQAGLEPFVTRLITAFQQETQPLPVISKPSA
jgi:LuxR family maltose regulon positive regulatory protein